MSSTAKYRLELDEGDRQLVLMALAHLAVERPGWEHWCENVAGPIDAKDEAGGPKLMREFAKMHREAPFDVRIEAAVSARIAAELERRRENA